jgi:hypothetical protein
MYVERRKSILFFSYKIFNLCPVLPLFDFYARGGRNTRLPPTAMNKTPPLFAILIHINQVHDPPLSYLRYILIVSSNVLRTITSSNWPFFSRRIHQNLVCISALPFAFHMPNPTHSPSFNHPNYILRGAQIIKLLVMLSLPLLCYFVPLRSKYLHQHHILEHPQPMVFP